jgi:hypothetical protein
MRGHAAIEKDGDPANILFLRRVNRGGNRGECIDACGYQRNSVRQLTFCNGISVSIEMWRYYSRVALARLEDVVCFNICAQIRKQ